jgi:hypothetical protein
MLIVFFLPHHAWRTAGKAPAEPVLYHPANLHLRFQTPILPVTPSTQITYPIHDIQIRFPNSCIFYPTL